MTARLTSPIERETGLPYLILPREPDVELPIGHPDLVNDHHTVHPRFLYRALDLNALRNAQIQAVDATLHNRGSNTYHDHYWGRRPPNNPRTVFERTFWPTVGLQPIHGIDLSASTPIERPMTDDEIRFFRTLNPKEGFAYKYTRYGYTPIRDFFCEYVAAQLDSRYQGRVIEFLSTSEPDRRSELADFLLRQAIRLAADPLRERYTELRDAGRLHPAMPAKPDTVLRYKLGCPDYEEPIIDRFAGALVTRAAIGAA